MIRIINKIIIIMSCSIAVLVLALLSYYLINKKTNTEIYSMNKQEQIINKDNMEADLKLNNNKSILNEKTNNNIIKQKKEADEEKIDKEKDIELKKFKLTGKDENGWNIYKSDYYGFQISYPEYINVLGEYNEFAINKKNDSFQIIAGDGDVDIHIVSNEYNSDIHKICNKNKESTYYSGKNGNSTTTIEKADFTTFDANISTYIANDDKTSEIFLYPLMRKILEFRVGNYWNSIQIDIPNKNKDIIELADQIFKSIKILK